MAIIGVAACTTQVPIFNSDIEVSHVERMSYPLPGRVHAEQGAVVVKVDLSSDGSVRDAVALSGPKSLVEECVANARKWRFRRVSRGLSYLVYIFRIAGVCELPCSSNFEYYPPNLVVISVGEPLVMP
jgi:hypothetical protein